MAQLDPKSPKDKNPRNFGNDNNFNWRGILLFACAIALLGGFLFSRNTNYGNVEEIPFTEFQRYLDEGRISRDEPLQLIVTEGRTTQTLRGSYDRARKPSSAPGAPDHFKTTVFIEYNKNLESELAAKGYRVDIKADSDLMVSALVQFAPIALFFLILYFFFRQQIRNAGKGALSFGKSKARMLARDRNRVTFKDVAGIEEAKEEVQEIVDFLKDPKKFQKLGGRIPKGVLMVGPPGTGKTLLARAIAGEADVPFFSISGSDFVEMFVGVGASRVRDMFEQGKKSAPCIIFIDEIDAVGRHRGHGVGGGHDEREQTLNALLVEMDGFDTQEGVIIIAATNRPDVLDPALLRPGRFDRQITVNLPDGKGRRSLALIEKEKQNTAYHEAGHALLLVLLPHTEPLHKVTIIPRGPSLGSTMWLPEEDKYTNRKNELLASLAVAMGGRVAEEIIFGDITNGARGDIRGATAIARRMVCEWGMSEKMGMVEYGEHEDYVFLGRDISRARDYSEATAEQIDQEVRRLIDDAYQLARTTLTANRDKLEAIAKALLEFETLDGSQLKEIVEHGRLINPPPPIGGSPAKKPAPDKPPKQVVAPDVAPPLPGALGGAPA